ncbi:MAG TPA: hypothetical protein VFS97_02550 [Nitrososphaeraceae archaeon]|nr:hypothetical protein [Nitrososphaeraceae archaeon]
MVNRSVSSSGYYDDVTLAISLYGLGPIYEKVGMKQEIDAVIDSLWNIDKEIRHLVYKEKELLGLDVKEGDDLRKLLTLVKNYEKTMAD